MRGDGISGGSWGGGGGGGVGALTVHMEHGYCFWMDVH